MSKINRRYFAKGIFKPLFGKRDCPNCEAHKSRFEYIVGQWTGVVLTWLAVRASKRGDTHLANHMTVAVLLGNSCHCPGGRWTGCAVGSEPLNFHLLRDRMNADDLNLIPFRDLPVTDKDRV
ncbi:hypothetical protein [Aeromicrobium sp. 179-A 4D2 NHS]|uniref:hypothetical protein n=1 Tax=Aeromicrobium sp. 179-A 4D2 NHS TaxID=3142375 RepID=UPI0039A04D68